MTRIWYDTEFLEDGERIWLISIGLVAEDGREFYAVSRQIEQDPLYEKICGHDWLMRNVVPYLPLRTMTLPDARYPGVFRLDDSSPEIMPRAEIRAQVRRFIEQTEKPELWAWYGAYDHVTLAQLFGTMMDLPAGVPMWTNDLKQECVRRGDPRLPARESGEHHALADARWTRDTHLWLDGYVPEHPRLVR